MPPYSQVGVRTSAWWPAVKYEQLLPCAIASGVCSSERYGGTTSLPSTASTSFTLSRMQGSGPAGLLGRVAGNGRSGIDSRIRLAIPTVWSRVPSAGWTFTFTAIWPTPPKNDFEGGPLFLSHPGRRGGGAVSRSAALHHGMDLEVESSHIIWPIFAKDAAIPRPIAGAV